MANPDPKTIAPILKRAQAAANSGDMGAAKRLLSGLVRNFPNLPEAHYELGRIATHENRIPQALKFFERALHLRPDAVPVWAAALRAAIHPDAGDAADRLVAKLAASSLPAPAKTALIAERARLAQTSGDRDTARRITLDHLAQNPADPVFGLFYTSLGKITPGDPHIAAMSDAYDHGDLADDARRRLAYALAKAAIDTGATDKVFGFLNTANALGRASYPYDFAQDAALAEEIRRIYRERPFSGSGDTRAGAIFVTGMPRSGTTLVEQILSSHPGIAGAGEAGLIAKPLRVLIEAERDAKRETTLARDYWAALSRTDPKAKMIVDKSINSYLFIGFLAQILPSAKFVIVHRDPLDNAFSIYRNMFMDGRHRYANDLRDIARVMRLFETQVAFWRDALPGRLVEITYENLVADLEPQASALVEHVGMDWDPACLQFHENTRRVETLSALQVRQPIYGSSVGIAQRYRAEMVDFEDEYARLA